jgi:hypothetical protein
VKPTLPILNMDGETMTFYHGTRQPFHRGGLLIPLIHHGGLPTTAPRTSRPLSPEEQEVVEDAINWVFVTQLWEVARTYALAAPGRGQPRILVVKPDVHELKYDPEHSRDFQAWRCRSATVLEVFINPPSLLQEQESP